MGRNVALTLPPRERGGTSFIPHALGAMVVMLCVMFWALSSSAGGEMGVRRLRPIEALKEMWEARVRLSRRDFRASQSEQQAPITEDGGKEAVAQPTQEGKEEVADAPDATEHAPNQADLPPVDAQPQPAPVGLPLPPAAEAPKPAAPKPAPPAAAPAPPPAAAAAPSKPAFGTAPEGRFFKTEGVGYLVLLRGYVGVASLPQVVLEAGILAAELGRTLVEPCVSNGEIVPCSCAPGAVRYDVPTAAPDASKDAQQLEKEDAAAFPRSSYANVNGWTFPLGGLVDWTRVAGATGAQTASFQALCKDVRTSLEERLGDRGAPLFEVPLAYCGSSEGECRAGLQVANQFRLRGVEGLVQTGPAGGGSVAHLSSQNSQLLVLIDYVPGSVRRLPTDAAAGPNLNLKFNASSTGTAGPLRAGLAAAASRLVPWSPYQHSVAASWLKTQFGEAPKFLALHWQTARTPRDYYPACQDKMMRNVNAQFRDFVSGAKAVLLSDAPAQDNPNQLIPLHKDASHGNPRLVTRMFQDANFKKYDGGSVQRELDTGVVAVRDMIIGSTAGVYLACVGDRILDCKGCMDAESMFDSVVIEARTEARLPSGRNVFTDTAAVLAAQQFK